MSAVLEDDEAQEELKDNVDEEFIEESDGAEDAAEQREEEEGNVVAEVGPFAGYESSEEDFPAGITRNTIGNVPLHWYDEYDHLGYDVTGKKILKTARRDQIDEFLARTDDPNYWRTLYDEVNGREVILSDAQLEALRRIQSGEAAEPEFDQYENLIEYDNSEWMLHPLSNHMKPKSSFQPSKWEAARVAYLVKAIKRGWIKLDQPKPFVPKVFQMWADDEVQTNLPLLKHERNHIPAPKLKLPGHAESYHPPAEFLMTDKEKEKWINADPDERKIQFMPQDYSALRQVPTYPQSLRERFDRCLDLYMCPRQLKVRRNVNAEKLLAKLPKASDLRPFPTNATMEYVGHTDMVRTMDLSPDGQFLVTGSDDKTVRVWDVETCRCVQVWTFKNTINRVAWNPNPTVCVIAVAVGSGFWLVSPNIATPDQQKKTDDLFQMPEKKSFGWKVYKSSSEKWAQGMRVFFGSSAQIDTLHWHRKGDYLLTLSRQDTGPAIRLHRLTTRQSHNMFKKTKGDIQDAQFHPTKPFLVIVTKTEVRIYDLTTQKLEKKMKGNVKWFSRVIVHPSGDHVIGASYDRRVVWFDLDMGDTPYKTLRYHKEGVASLAVHNRLPLFASCSHDGNINVFHGRVFDSYNEDALIVPLKVLRGHQIVEGAGVLDIVFHKTLPWIFSCGADKTVKLWTDMSN